MRTVPRGGTIRERTGCQLFEEQSGRTKFYEGVREPGEEAYVLGEARETEAAWGEERYVITGGSAPEAFIISDMSERELTASEVRGAKVRFILGLAVVLFGLGLLSVAMQGFGLI